MKPLLIPLVAALAAMAALTGPAARAQPSPPERIVKALRDGKIGDNGNDPRISAWSLFLTIEGEKEPLVLPPYVVTSQEVTRANPSVIGSPADLHYRICVQNVSDRSTQALGSVAFAELSPPDPKAKSSADRSGYKLHVVDLPRAIKPKQRGCVEGDLKPRGEAPSIWVLTPHTKPTTPVAGAKP